MRILALADHSLYGKSVIDHAAWAANQGASSVTVVNIVSPNELIAERMPVHPGGALAVASQLMSVDELTDLRHRGEAMVAEAKATLEAAGVSNTQVRVEEGVVQEIAVEESKSADLLIIGKRGEHADLSRLPLGSNVEPIARGSLAPVLVVSRMLRPIQRALLAFDTDESCAAAVELLAAGKLLPPMPLLLVHAGEAKPEITAAMTAAAERLEAAGYATTAATIDGDPARVIAEQVVADTSDLVIMGAFGGSRLKSFFIGSLTSFVIRASQTPVLLVGRHMDH